MGEYRQFWIRSSGIVLVSRILDFDNSTIETRLKIINKFIF